LIELGYGPTWCREIVRKLRIASGIDGSGGGASPDAVRDSIFD